MLVKTGTVDHILIKSHETYAAKDTNGQLLYMTIIGLGKPGGHPRVPYKQQLKPGAYALKLASDTALTHSSY